jgi:hypothetical protein
MNFFKRYSDFYQIVVQSLSNLCSKLSSPLISMILICKTQISNFLSETPQFAAYLFYDPKIVNYVARSINYAASFL